MDFRILKQKSTRGYSAVPSVWIQIGAAGRTKRGRARKHLFGFRNRKFATSPVREVAYTFPLCQ